MSGNDHRNGYREEITMKKNPYYWYAAGLKKGGVMLFSSHKRYSAANTADQTRFKWLSKPFPSKDRAMNLLTSSGHFKNPPTKVMIVHSGKVVVQHLGDPARTKAYAGKTQKNPAKKFLDVHDIHKWLTLCDRWYPEASRQTIKAGSSGFLKRVCYSYTPYKTLVAEWFDGNGWIEVPDTKPTAGKTQDHRKR